MECYLENDGDWDWNMWRRVQGEGNVYLLTSYMSSWAEMDESDEAGQECTSIVQNIINPSVESGAYNLARTVPELSAQPMQPGVVYVNFWKTSHWQNFTNTVRQVSDAVRSQEGEPRGFWYYNIGGGPEASDAFVVTPYENFAAMDESMDSVWELVEREHGERKKNELRNTFAESIDDHWSYIYRRDSELSRPDAEEEEE